MKNPWFRNALKIWIALTSVAAFVTGWTLLGHSGKPVSTSALNQPARIAPLPTLQPLPTLDPNGGLQALPQQQQSSNFSFMPRMRTMGS